MYKSIKYIYICTHFIFNIFIYKNLYICIQVCTLYTLHSHTHKNTNTILYYIIYMYISCLKMLIV
ncbi:hypothetical protein J3Q64DRAFT_1766868 [Phycomyces blakesleeanus]|uniref:C2H2-type zinc finger transcription factor n=1 Tax=Phycomyces blakesleeanus TaxID=4837 RepID=A0ABR3APK6_PHYBL